MSIAEKAMLTALSINLWTARRIDDKATKTVMERHKVGREMGRYNKALIRTDADVFANVQKLATEAREWHYAHTLPWVHKGAQLLPAAEYLEYAGTMRGYGVKFDAAVQEFISAYPALKAEAKKNLNGLFREDEYPSVKDLGRKYGFGFTFLPVPDADDFRVDVGKADEARIKAGITAQLQQATEQAMRDLWTRLHEPVRNMAAALQDPERRFHDTLVENLKEVVEVLPRLNLTGDEDLDAMVAEVKKSLTKFGPQALREDDEKRKATAKRAKEIAEKMAAFCT